jgi:hypothetical protein
MFSFVVRGSGRFSDTSLGLIRCPADVCEDDGPAYDLRWAMLQDEDEAGELYLHLYLMSLMLEDEGPHPCSLEHFLSHILEDIIALSLGYVSLDFG